MNKPNTTCRVCGKEYYCCADSRHLGSWRTMACSPEHYQEYMRRIEESRTQKNVEMEAVKASSQPKKKPVKKDKIDETVVDRENEIKD